MDPVKNFALCEVSIGYDAAATSIVLASGKGALFPQPSTDGAFNGVWWRSDLYTDPSKDSNKEIVRITARTTDTLTITRAQEGTTATVKNASGGTYSFMLALTAKMITDLVAAIPTILMAHKTTDELVNNSDVLQNDDHLFVSVAANSVYIVELNINGGANDATSKLLISFTAPASSTMKGFVFHNTSSRTAFDQIYSGNLLGSVNNSIWGYNGSGYHSLLMIKAILKTAGTAGTLQFQWSQVTPVVADTYLRISSHLKLIKVS